MDKQNLEAMRHSCEHVLTMAMVKLYPGLKPAMGPATEDGFYFDFDYSSKISEEDFPKIEAEMQKIIKADLPFVHSEISVEEARKVFADNPYKIEWAEEADKKGEKVSIYTIQGQSEAESFIDVCKGPHVESTGKIGPFKLLSIAGAYWHGDEKNKMLTRIYGICFPTQQELDNHLHMLEEAKKRDHRKLGKELELFAVPDDVGPGLFIWLPKGYVVFKELEKFELDLQQKMGYQNVRTPHIGKKELWVRSGHWDLYRDKMYSPMKIDDEEYLVKPMNCPMHIMVYKNKIRSYKELPLKIGEVASVYRYEQSGELSGLTRVRYFNQDDSHIFCMPDQVETEVIKVLDLLEQLYKSFGLTEIKYWFTIRSEDKKDKYLGDDNMWAQAEAAIESALKQKGAKYTPEPGEAKFYGPSIDVMVNDSLGRKWQCGTIQVDFALPERFEMEYIGSDGQTHRPVMIHRALFGSVERFLAVVIEHLAGNFPVWLSPVQVQIIPITDRQNDYAQNVLEQLMDANIRVGIDSRSEKMQAKIRDAQMQKIPYMLIIGDKEVEGNTVAVRTREGEDLGAIKLDGFQAKILGEIKNRS